MTTLDFQTSKLDADLTAIHAETLLLTDDAHLLGCVANLLQDCRDILRDSGPATALAYADHLARCVPEYFRRERAQRGSFNERAH